MPNDFRPFLLLQAVCNTKNFLRLSLRIFQYSFVYLMQKNLKNEMLTSALPNFRSEFMLELEELQHMCKQSLFDQVYRTRAIITRGLYLFTPFFTLVYIVERLVLHTIYLCSKQGNSSIIGSKIRGLKLREVSDQEWFTMVRVWQVDSL